MRITREEFIDRYIKKSGFEKYRTEDGFQIGEYRRRALPCTCDYEGCQGWAMVSDENAEDHLRFYGPKL